MQDQKKEQVTEPEETFMCEICGKSTSIENQEVIEDTDEIVCPKCKAEYDKE